MSAEPSTSRLAATVTDEAEELAAEAGTSSAAPASGQLGYPTLHTVHCTDPSAAAANGDVKTEETADGDTPNGTGEEDKEEEDPNKIPDDACETLYLQNLNEKVRLPGECGLLMGSGQASMTTNTRTRTMLMLSVLKETLATLFKPYRPLLPVVAHRNQRMRGQAFVTFQEMENANKARKEVAEFPLYGKALVG